MDFDFITIPLYEHQKTSILNMEQLEHSNILVNSEFRIETKLGILADLPGYGKTLSILGLIGKTLFDQDQDDFFLKEKIEICSNCISKIKIKRLEQLNISLILVNVSLMTQWILELSKTNLRYLAIYNKCDIEGIDMSKYDLILVSNNIYNSFTQVYRNKYWKRFIIDEPVSLKITSMGEIDAKFYWLVTATPYELYPRGRSGFLNDLLPELELLKYITVKNEDQYVKMSYDMPITNHISYKITCDISKLFDSLLNRNTMEMLEAGDIQGVLSSFGNTSEFIIESFKNRKQKRINELMNDEKNIDKIQEIQNHLHLLDERIKRYANENLCILCNQPHHLLYILSCCQSLYCGCLASNNCPLCKTFDIKHSLVLNDSYDDYKSEYNVRNITKIQQIIHIISDITFKKILIFSNFNESFIIIKKFLEEKQINYLELRGTKEKRDNTIDLYKTGNVNVLLLNTIHSGAGLNLPETTDIIIYHHLHEYQKTQVLGRANRIGRKTNLNVHYLE